MPKPSVIIIGTGFGGIGAAIRLKQQGISQLTIFEKAADIGGVWRDNVYPGAACDVPSHLYSYSFEPKADWTRRYAEQPEIHAYLRHCVDKYQLAPHLRLSAEVRAAVFNEARAHWQVTLANGEVHEARVLVTATGQLNRPLMPSLPGLQTFAGPQFHSARWDHSVDLRDKKVAVIGTGASAIQFVPRIAPIARSVTLFQRSAPYVIPKGDRIYGKKALGLFARLPLLQTLSRAKEYVFHEARALGIVGFPALTALMKPGFKRNLHGAVQDPAVRSKLTPDYPVGCKRIMISNDYYTALARSDVHLVTDSIAEIEAGAVVTRDGVRHEADVLIYGTGFAALDFLAPIAITGLQGRELNRSWQRGAEAYLGITVSGFPSLFMLYGPNTNLGHSSIVYVLESQIAYLLDAIRQLDQHRWLDVKPAVQSSFNERIQQRSKSTVWDAGCTSWYKTAAGKNTNNWPGYTFEYRRATRRLRLSDYHLG